MISFLLIETCNSASSMVEIAVTVMLICIYILTQEEYGCYYKVEPTAAHQVCKTFYCLVDFNRTMVFAVSILYWIFVSIPAKF